jgi:hypothetical protein
MSILIDKLVHDAKNDAKSCIDGVWYLSKDTRYFDFSRFKDAWRVLIGRSRAYHYKIDEVKK